MKTFILVDGSNAAKMAAFSKDLDGKKEFIGKNGTYKFHEVNQCGCRLWKDNGGMTLTDIDVYLREN